MLPCLHCEHWMVLFGERGLSKVWKRTIIVIPVSFVIHRNKVHEEDVLGCRVHVCDVHLKCREHPPCKNENTPELSNKIIITTFVFYIYKSYKLTFQLLWLSSQCRVDQTPAKVWTFPTGLWSVLPEGLWHMCLRPLESKANPSCSCKATWKLRFKASEQLLMKTVGYINDCMMNTMLFLLRNVITIHLNEAVKSKYQKERKSLRTLQNQIS